MARRPYSQHPYQYGYSNPHQYVDPDGNLAILPFLIRAGANGVVDLLFQVATNYFFDDSVTTVEEAFHHVDWLQVGGAFLEGFVGGRYGPALIQAALDVRAQAKKCGEAYTIEQGLKDFSYTFLLDAAPGVDAKKLRKLGVNAVDRPSPRSIRHGDELSGLPKRPRHKLSNALKGWRPPKLWAHGEEVVFTKEKMEYIVSRHHPEYWEALREGERTLNTAFDSDLSVDDVVNLIQETLKEKGGKIRGETHFAH